MEYNINLSVHKEYKLFFSVKCHPFRIQSLRAQNICGQWTKSGQDEHLSGQSFGLPVILTRHMHCKKI